jgi:hypothetical protein
MIHRVIAIAIGVLVATSPAIAGGRHDWHEEDEDASGCGWCGPAASLGRALALGGPAPCYCPPETPPPPPPPRYGPPPAPYYPTSATEY